MEQKNVKREEDIIHAKISRAQNELAYVRKNIDAIEHELDKAMSFLSVDGYDPSYIAEKVDKAQTALCNIVNEVNA